MEFKKNQIVELYIDDIGNEGEGIGHIDGYALFLKDAVIGDKVRAKIIKEQKKSQKHPKTESAHAVPKQDSAEDVHYSIQLMKSSQNINLIK